MLASFQAATSRFDALRLLKALSLSKGIPQSRDSIGAGVGFGRVVWAWRGVAALRGRRRPGWRARYLASLRFLRDVAW